MSRPDFSLRALYEALDDRRRVRGISWAAVTREVNRFITDGHPIATSSITGLKTKSVGEGDGILQMLLWLGRTPESFVPGVADADAKAFRLLPAGEHEILRWDSRALYTALNAERHARHLTWTEIAREIGVTTRMLTNLSNGVRLGFPGVKRIVGWLGQPAANFTRAVPNRRPNS